MNAKDFYLAIGQISDDLILEAGTAGLHRWQGHARRLWMAAAAACFCLLLGGYLRFFGTVAIWNTGITMSASKTSIPEDSAIQSLPPDALQNYYHIALPDTLGGLTRTSAEAFLYTDAQGSVLYDRNLIRYESADGTKGLNLTLSRVSPAPQSSGETASRIRGVAVTLTQDTSIPGYLLLNAQWEQDGTTLCLAAEGLERDELISILKELIGL